MLTAILELGAWLGTLINGYLADALGRRVTVVVAVVIFAVGVIVQACTVNKDFVLAGRFVTGLGVGNLSMIVPLYNAELVSEPVAERVAWNLRDSNGIRLPPKFAARWLLSSSCPSPSVSWLASG